MEKSYALYRFPYDSRFTKVSSTGSEPEILRSYADLTCRNGFVFAPFEISEDNPLIVIRPDIVETFELDDMPEAGPLSFVTKDLTAERKAYGTAFNKFHDKLKQGIFQKIVLSRSSEEEATDAVSPETLFRRACSLYPRTFVALVSTPLCGTWLTATPEILLEGRDNHWHTMALAGTMRIEEGSRLSELPDSRLISEMSAKWDEKNIKEQRYVAQYISQALRRFTTTVEESAPHTVRAGNLLHLVSDFNFTFQSDKELGPLIRELHPTPAVCGIPKQETFRFITGNEPHQRGYYSGFAGPLHLNNSTNLFVTLRCMKIEDGRYRLYAGGGLLDDSEEQAEWLETEAKMETMRRCFAIKRT